MVDFLSYRKYNDFMWKVAMTMKTGRPKAEHTKSKSVTVRLSDELHYKLSEYAASHEITMTEVIQQSLKDFFSKQK